MGSSQSTLSSVSSEESASAQRAAGGPRAALKRVQRYPDQPTPPTARVRMTPIAVGGTLLWTIAAVLAQLFRDQLAESGREWWVAASVCGILLGIIGTAVMVVFDRRRTRSAPDQDGTDQSSSEPSSS
jgi:hypothetical protein